jgi:hypothetical protein
MSNPQPSDALAWHRKFAAAANNRAWELSVQERSQAEDREMLNAAHASAWHWAHIGLELNRMRATMLLAEVHALLGVRSSAWAYAEEVREYFLRVGAPEWEIAFVHVIHAHAAAVAGQREAHIASYALAVAALAAVPDEEERGIVSKTFAHVPKP